MQTLYRSDEEPSVDVQYELNPPNGGRLTPRLDYHYRSEIRSAINYPQALLDDVTLMNFRLA